MRQLGPLTAEGKLLKRKECERNDWKNSALLLQFPKAAVQNFLGLNYKPQQSKLQILLSQAFRLDSYSVDLCCLSPLRVE